ncbi:hypothetical protein JCM15519_10640 [Fundidesulfovibrio butyratiphilus]
MVASILRLAPVVLLLILPLFGCTEYSQGGGYYAPPPPGYYGNPYQGYTRSPRSYDEEYANYKAYEERRRKVEVNCTMGWQNCMNMCNASRDPHQRNMCVANCNNARNNCLRNF